MTEDDGFIEILPTREAKAAKAAVTVAAVAFGRQKTRYLSITFHPDHLDEGARRILTGPRFNVAFNPAMRCLRIRAADGMGKFETRRAPRGTAETLRVPFPAGDTVFYEKRVAVEFDVNVAQRVILIDLPAPFHPASVPASRSASVASNAAFELRRQIVDSKAAVSTSELMGDPPRGRSALDQRKAGK